MVTKQQQAYDAFEKADNEWQACLVKIFGNKAGDIRYTQIGHEHPECVDAYRKFTIARDEWYRLTRQPNPWKEATE